MADALDEMVDGGGRTRPAWRGIGHAILGLGPNALGERARMLVRAAAEEGAAGPASPGLGGAGLGSAGIGISGMGGAGLGVENAAWICDPVPLPLGSGAFADIARGLAQRAVLIERVLADLYGEQSLLADGHLPPHLVFGSRDFLRSSRRGGTALPRRMLGLYAADLVRGPDGAWRVIADRCARPGGIAASLEHRRQLRRVMPELFAEPVADIGGFFDVWRETLRDIASPYDGEAGLALLTPGYADPGWSEHVMLARALGCHLVRGTDLTLREGRLWVKTLRGLKRVDLLLNRQEPLLLDPLELDWNSGAGVPGLMAACRSGRVKILNDPGSAIAETPGIAAFLPALAHTLLDERLMLPDAGLVWLGHASARAQVLDDPDAWEIRSSTTNAASPVPVAALSPVGRARLLAAIAERPGDFVAGRPIAGSVAPTVVHGKLEPRRVVLRVFLIRGRNGWIAMDGGFARVVPDGMAITVGLPRAGVAKDVLVIADDEQAAPLRVERAPEADPEPVARLRIRHVEGDLPARVAEEFYRLGRSVEQLERQARLVRVLASRLVRFTQRPRELVELRILASCVAPTGLLPEETLIDPAAPGLVDALARLAEPASLLAQTVNSIGLQIDHLHDRLTDDMHGVLLQALADTRCAFAETRGHGSLDALAHVTVRILGLTATIAGLAAETMVRGGGWMFLDMGLRLARAEAVCMDLAAAIGPAASLPTHPGRAATAIGPDIETGLRLILELRDSLITYRSRYGARIEAGVVLDLVIADVSNPRALCYQIDAARSRLARLAEIGGAEFTQSAELLATEANLIVASVIEADDETQAAAQLPARLAALLAGITGLRRAIARRYLDLLPETRTMAS